VIQVILIRQLLATDPTDPTATPEQLSVRFGRKNPKRTEQIKGMIETLKELGQVWRRGAHAPSRVPGCALAARRLESRFGIALGS
jgi:hypothetical protein